MHLRNVTVILARTLTIPVVNKLTCTVAESKEVFVKEEK